MASHANDSPRRRKEKRSKRNQDRTAAPKPSGCTKVACPHDGASGSRARAAACGHSGQGSAAAPPHLARAFVGDDPIVDKEEEALEHTGRTITTQILHTPCSGPTFVSDLVPFEGPLPVLWEP